MENMTLDEKYQRLLGIISAERMVAVAFSGGVDSSFLCYAAHEALGDKAVAITVISPLNPKEEIECAVSVAEKIGIEHILTESPDIAESVAVNSKERCYFCKKIVFAHILNEAAKREIETVLDGSNVDDIKDYRPGAKALEELRILSPLQKALLSKDEIRELSRRFDLPTHDKPAFACLASRIPYGERIDKEKLARIEKSENILRKAGFRQFRVRSHENIARIEVAPEERHRFFDESVMDNISRALKECGFVYVALELEGYVMGSMNRAIFV